MAAKQNNLHAIIIPLPYQGHINPLVNLALKIASKGIKVTFVHLEFVHLKLSKAHHNNTSGVDLFSEARSSGLDISYTTIGDGFPLEFDRDLNFSTYWNFLVRDFPAHVDEFVGNLIKSDPGSAHFLVADPISSWPAAVAEKYNLVYVGMWTQAAFVFCLAYHWELLREKGHLTCKDNEDLEIDYIPGVPSINTKDLMKYLDPENVVSEGMSIGLNDARKADFILHNTVEELEPHALSTLNRLYQPSYTVGPTPFYHNLSTFSVPKSFWFESDCAGWLGSRPAGSVLYVSFGSIVRASDYLIREVAHGLLHSGVSFIWVVRDDDSINSVLPVGFEDKIKNKALVVPWCDQIRVLSSPAVGGFLTHCGWNSTLESMWCGVPMICCPLEFDQPTVTKLVVDDWGLGIRLSERGRKVDRHEIGEMIKGFMCGSVGKGIREEVGKLKGLFRRALEVGGSSERNFERFVDDLKEKVVARAGN
ncbi:UDP-glycosyltransferase 86A1 [Striga hermonthica]|uniref:Glycosyltransferase n=1 Tax=Striga hermonthica TaxID=68872 RepID=A0A9N7RH05_STRHE|nr:UDP-glycosyltransferase 86A1 [Striga hermonthica]